MSHEPRTAEEREKWLILKDAISGVGEDVLRVVGPISAVSKLASQGSGAKFDVLNVTPEGVLTIRQLEQGEGVILSADDGAVAISSPLPQEELYVGTGDTTSGTWEEIDTFDFNVTAGDYWVDAMGDFAGSVTNKNYGGRFLIGGVVCCEIDTNIAKADGGRTLSFMDSHTVPSDGTLTVSFEAYAEAGTNTVNHWAVKIRKTTNT